MFLSSTVVVRPEVRSSRSEVLSSDTTALFHEVVEPEVQKCLFRIQAYVSLGKHEQMRNITSYVFDTFQSVAIYIIFV